MPSIEDRIRTQLGSLMMENAVLATQLEQAQARIAELEKDARQNPVKDKPDLRAVDKA